MKLTGYEAIEYARNNNLTLNKYNDPTEDARTGLSIEEAEEIAQEDHSLIWVEVKAWDFYTEDSTEGEEGLEGTEEEVKFDIMYHYERSEWPKGWHLVPAGSGR